MRGNSTISLGRRHSMNSCHTVHVNSFLIVSMNGNGRDGSGGIVIVIDRSRSSRDNSRRYSGSVASTWLAMSQLTKSDFIQAMASGVSLRI
jgi:hypothetical protein